MDTLPPSTPQNGDAQDASQDAQQSDAQPPTQALTLQQVTHILEHGAIDTVHGLIRWSSNYTFLISVVHEGVSLHAVYKPQSGERPLWDFPDGTLCYRERAAFLTAEALGWEIVPPTVLREGPRGLGSVQFFVDHDPNYHYFEFDEDRLPELARMAVFDAVVNNADRKGGHCIIDEQGHMWGIDHGICFHAVNKLRTVIWDFAGQPIPDIFLEGLRSLSGSLNNPDSPYIQAMQKLLTAREMKALTARTHRLLTEQRYPLPGPGPNQPWPPV